MKNFQRGGGGGGKRFGKGDFGKRNFDDRGSRPLYKAVCFECGNSCEVPFKPTNDRPVYCNNCFKKGDNGGNLKRSDVRNYEDRDEGRYSERPPMFKAICEECGSSCEVPFKPTGNKPVYCNNCFKKDGGNHRNGGNKDLEAMKEQFEIFNIKLDRILKILTSPAPSSDLKVSKPRMVEKPEQEKIEKKSTTPKVKKTVKAKKSKEV